MQVRELCHLMFIEISSQLRSYVAFSINTNLTVTEHFLYKQIISSSQTQKFFFPISQGLLCNGITFVSVMCQFCVACFLNLSHVVCQYTPEEMIGFKGSMYTHLYVCKLCNNTSDYVCLLFIEVLFRNLFLHTITLKNITSFCFK